MNSELAVFESVLVVQLDEANQPKVTYRFPVVVDIPKNDVAGAVMRFCFPETEDPAAGTDKKKKKKQKKNKGFKSTLHEQATESFSFVLTDSDGSRKFGYCRRMKILDQETSKKTLECYTILSLRPSFGLFRQMFEIIEERRKISKTAVYQFLKAVQLCKFPGPGETVTVRSYEGTWQLSRALGTGFEYLDYVTYATLFKALPIPKILELFSNLLLERRCIVAAKSLGMLSSCINALSVLLYPFSWQHVFIPVLPLSLIDYCCAPMPFLLGILSSSLPNLKNLPLEEVYIVDMDKASFIKNPGFPNLLPVHELRTLEMSLNAIKNSGSKGRIFDSEVARAFLDFFQSIFGGYAKFMRGNKFDLAGFKAAQPPDSQAFLQEFEASQMWSCFLMEREAMSSKGILQKECPLLKVLELSQAERLADEDKPAVFQVCSKCGGDIDGELEDKDGRPVCQECLEAKNRRKVGWFKSLMGQGKEGEEGQKGSRIEKPKEADTTTTPVKPQAGNSFRVSERTPPLNKSSPASTSAPQLPTNRTPSHTSPIPVLKTTLEDPKPSPMHHHKTFSNPSPVKAENGSPPPRFRSEPDASFNSPRSAPVPSSQGVSNLTAKFQQPSNNYSNNGQTSLSTSPGASPKPTRPPKPSPPESKPAPSSNLLPVPPRPTIPRPTKGLPPVPSKPGPPAAGGGSAIGGTKFCSECGKPLQEQTAINALDGLWHSHCFVCAHCSQEFKNFKFVLCDNKPYHPACKRTAFGRTCKRCGKGLEGKCVKADGNMYHQNCFVCGRCKAQLSTDYVEVAGQIYCEKCRR